MRSITITVWSRVVEASLVLGAACCTALMVMVWVWTHDDAPSFLEDQAPNANYIENPASHPGGMIYSIRTVRKMDDCAVRTGVWVVARPGGTLYSVTSSLFFSRQTKNFVVARVGYTLPTELPLGSYSLRAFASCQKNPLSEVSQKFIDLPFEVGPQ